MKELLEYLPLIIVVGSAISFFIITRSNTITNKTELENIKEEQKSINERLSKKDTRIKELESEKIRFTEALERTYMTNTKAYESFVEKLAYEKEMIRIEKSIEIAVKSMETNSEKTLDFLQDILSQKAHICHASKQR